MPGRTYTNLGCNYSSAILVNGTTYVTTKIGSICNSYPDDNFNEPILLDGIHIDNDKIWYRIYNNNSASVKPTRNGYGPQVRVLYVKQGAI